MLALGALIASCGEKKEKKEGFEMNRAKTEKKAEATKSEGVPVDLDNDGVGPFKDISFPAEINTELAAAGKAKFNLCMACHTAETRLIGPALKGVYERRSPAW